MSPFAALLVEARDRLRRRCRRTVALHFDWDGTDAPDSWKAWADDPTLLAPDLTPDGRGPRAPAVFTGCAGEQALRNMVDAIRKRDGG